MGDLLGFARKPNDEWTVQDNERIKEYIPKYRAKCSFKTRGRALDEIIVILRENYPDYTPDKRNDGALSRRIDMLDKVLAGEIEEARLMAYDRPFYKRLLRGEI